MTAYYKNPITLQQGIPRACKAPWRGVGCPHSPSQIPPPKAAQEKEDLNNYKEKLLMVHQNEIHRRIL
jgi:hypothetical protein